MITIKNIHIEFGQILINQGNLEIEEGKLCALQGKSGSGKTSLLYIAGLLSTPQNIEYTFNNHVIKLNDDEIALFRKKHIGYVFQENSLIEHLSIYENMKLYRAMVDKDISETEAKSLLKTVHLDKNIHQSTTTLSGGERQRLAIACAISKNPELLILDEPTSALDHHNMQMMMDILKKLAKNGMMILLASHDQEVINQCDIVYQIQNQQLIRNQKSKKNGTSKLYLEKIHLKPSFYFSYYKNYLKTNYIMQNIMFIMCSISIAIIVGTSSICQGYEKKQLENMDAIGNREIFITSDVNKNGDACYSVSLPPLDDTLIQRIKNNEKCEKVYPFYEGYQDKIILNNKEKQISFTIQPYAEEKRLGDYLQMGQNTVDGIYISSHLAHQLNISSLDNPYTISLTCLLPNGHQIEINHQKIDGILEANVENWYSPSLDILYLPIEMFPQTEKIQSLLVYATHFDKTDVLKKEITEINRKIGIFSPFSHSIVLSEAMKSMQTLTPFINTVLIFMTMMLIFLIYSKYISNRKKEICLLKVNGLSKKEITKLILYELIIQSLIIATCTIVLLTSLYMMVSKMMQLKISYNYFLDYLHSIFYSFLFMSVPSIVSLVIYQRYDVGIALRND